MNAMHPTAQSILEAPYGDFRFSIRTPGSKKYLRRMLDKKKFLSVWDSYKGKDVRIEVTSMSTAATQIWDGSFTKYFGGK